MTTQKKSKATKNSSTKTKKIVKSPKILSDYAKIRKKPKYKSFRLHKKVRHQDPKLPAWRNIVRKTFNLLKVNSKAIGWFFIVYGLLYLIFVSGFSSAVDVEGIRESFETASGGTSTALASNFTIFGLMLQSTVSVAGDVSGLYHLIFLIISVLALIWLFRQQQAGNKVTLKDAFYRGMYPLVPFILVLVIMLFQTIPATIGNFLFSTVISNGLAVTLLEQIIWFLLFISLLLLSMFMLSSSVIALYIVTLPEMTPKIALKKAKELVTFRRANIFGKFVALLIFVVLLYILIVFPSIFISAVLAQVVFFLLTVFLVPFITAYLFVLYRELL